METREQALSEAEAYIRRVLARLSDEPADEAEIHAAARKVVDIVPSFRTDSNPAAVIG